MDETRARQLLDDEVQRLETIEEDIDRGGLIPAADDQEVGEAANGRQLADVGTATEDRSRDLGLLEQVETELADVADALRRLEDGTYGRCAQCGEPIPDERLEANPTARYHVEHQPPADAPPLR